MKIYNKQKKEYQIGDVVCWKAERESAQYFCILIDIRQSPYEHLTEYACWFFEQQYGILWYGATWLYTL